MLQLRQPHSIILCLIATLFFPCSVHAGQVKSASLQPSVWAMMKSGRLVGLEVRPPKGSAAKTLLQPLLADPEAWEQYQGLKSAFISYSKLNAQTQRHALLALFPEDYVTAEGWFHVTANEEGPHESLWTLAELLTGLGTNFKKILAREENRGLKPELYGGQVVFCPRDLLLPALREPTRVPALEVASPLPEAAVSVHEDNGEPPVDLLKLTGELTYDEDGQGPYAVYRLKKGEAIYTSVVVRFTDFTDNVDILSACNVILNRSKIPDENDIKVGAPIHIPLEMLAGRFHPPGSEARKSYQASLQESERLVETQQESKDLAGVVVVLDPGHGGKDVGATHPVGAVTGLLEDEINYDIVMRIKALLERDTSARVYVTMVDRSQGEATTDARVFTHDTDEELLTTPRYPNNLSSTYSASLRFYLANSIYKKELARGVDKRNIVFASIHTDAQYKQSLRGAMVYIPGADTRARTPSISKSGSVYGRYAEVNEAPSISNDAKERAYDEAISRNFANAILQALGEHDPPIQRHKTGDPIRNVIRQSGGKSYLPAVIKHNKIPTKVLVETANLTNATDRERLSDPEWRQWFAESMVEALKLHFKSK